MSKRGRGVTGRILITAALLWSAGCAGPGSAPTPVTDAQRAAYESALQAAGSGRPGAGAALEAFLTDHPSSPMADDAALRLAELAFRDGREEDGLRWLGTIVTRYPTSDREPTARLRLAEHEYARDRRSAARGLLDPVDVRRLSEPDRRAALRLRASLSRTPVERMAAFARLQSAVREEARRSRRDPAAQAALEAEAQKVEREIDALIAGAADAELEAMLDQAGRRDPAGAIAYERARRAVEAEPVEAAREWLGRAERTAGSDAARERVRRLEARLDARANAEGGATAAAELESLRELSQYTRVDTRGAKGTLGVVLPLSGDFAEFGEASLRGILLAAGVFETGDAIALDGAVDSGVDAASGALGGIEPDRGDGPDVRLVVRDTGGDPARAAEAVRELAGREDVLAIVGPIFSDEALAAAEAADSAGVPLVTLSNREDVTRGRSFVLRTRTTPGDEVNVLVNHAVDRLSATRFGVLYPKTRYGRGMRKLYWDAILARGGKLVAMAGYSPEETDFSAVIKEMVGFRFLTAGERQALAARDRAVEAARSLPPEKAAAARRAAFEATGPDGEPLPPVVDFDVLFVPDSADAVAMIAPGLALQGVSGVRLLGSSDWLDAELLPANDRHVSGAVISAPFFAGSDVGVVRDFVGAYQQTFATTPDAYAAQGFDAAGLVLQQLVARDRDRASVRDGLLAVRAFPGASGPLTMLPDGNARRRPFLLEIAGQRFVPLD